MYQSEPLLQDVSSARSAAASTRGKAKRSALESPLTSPTQAASAHKRHSQGGKPATLLQSVLQGCMDAKLSEDAPSGSASPGSSLHNRAPAAAMAQVHRPSAVHHSAVFVSNSV